MSNAPTPTPQFTNSEWVEIYNAIDLGPQRELPPDSYLQNHGMTPAGLRLLSTRWHMVYDAVWHKLHPFAYAPDRKWRRELAGILDKLAEHAYCEMCGADCGKPHHDSGAKGAIVTLHATSCWPQSAGDKHRLCQVCLAGARQIWTAKGTPRVPRARKAA